MSRTSDGVCGAGERVASRRDGGAARVLRAIGLAAGLAVLGSAVADLAVAASGAWSAAATTSAWQTAANWVGGVPGGTTGDASPDAALFDSNSSTTTIAPDANRNLASIDFDTAAAAYTIGTTIGNRLVMTAGGEILISSALAGSNITETIDAPLGLAGNYAFANSSAAAQNDTLLFGGAISTAVAGAQTLQIAGTGAVTINGAIGDGTGTLALDLLGPGILTLGSANNTFTGGVTIDGGELQVGSSGALNAASPNTVIVNAAGTLSLKGHSVGVVLLPEGSGVIQNASATPATLTVNTQSGFSFAYPGSFQDGPGGAPLALAISGNGGMSLEAANSFTGGVTINDSASLGVSASALNSASPNAVAFGPGCTGHLFLDSNAITLSGLNTNANPGAPAIYSSLQPTTLTIDNANDNTYAGILQEADSADPLSLVESGAGALTLAGNNGFSGGVTLNSGAIVIGNNNALGSGTLTAGGGTLKTDGHGPYTISNPIDLAFDVLPLAASSSLTLSGPINGTGEIEAIGSGIVVLNGVASVNLGLYVESGEVQFGSGFALRPGSILGVEVDSGTLSLKGNSVAIDGLTGSGVIQNASSMPASLTVIVPQDTVTNFFGGLQDGTGGGALALVFTGGGGFGLLESSSFTGGVTLDPGQLTVGNNNALGTGTLTAAGGTLATDGDGPYTLGNAINLSALLPVDDDDDLTLSGPLGGSGGLVKEGGGTLTLTHAESFSGPLSVNSGTLRLNVVSGTSTVGSGLSVTVNNSATLELAGSVSALSSSTVRANIVNNSTAAAGILVSGTNQLVGKIDGTGTTQIEGGSDLTASHIVQAALLIGGDATQPARLTIAASDSLGNPLLPSPDDLVDAALNGSSLPGAPDAAVAAAPSVELVDRGAWLDDTSLAETMPTNLDDAAGNSEPVPEPSTLLLAMLGMLTLVCRRKKGDAVRRHKPEEGSG